MIDPYFIVSWIIHRTYNGWSWHENPMTSFFFSIRWSNTHFYKFRYRIHSSAKYTCKNKLTNSHGKRKRIKNYPFVFVYDCFSFFFFFLIISLLRMILITLSVVPKNIRIFDPRSVCSGIFAKSKYVKKNIRKYRKVYFSYKNSQC